MRQSEHVLYITLVDFLLQLLFLGLVLSVIYFSLQPNTESVENNQVFVDKIVKSTGISDLTALTDELTRLGPLREASKNLKTCSALGEAVERVGGKDKAIKVLDTEAKKNGQGLPSCIPGGKTVATFDAYIDRIELRTPVSPEMLDLLSSINVTPAQVSKTTLSGFSDIFSPLRERNKNNNCINNVVVYEHTYDTRPRDSFRYLFLAFVRKSPDLK